MRIECDIPVAIPRRIARARNAFWGCLRVAKARADASGLVNILTAHASPSHLHYFTHVSTNSPPLNSIKYSTLPTLVRLELSYHLPSLLYGTADIPPSLRALQISATLEITQNHTATSRFSNNTLKSSIDSIKVRFGYVSTLSRVRNGC